MSKIIGAILLAIIVTQNSFGLIKAEEEPAETGSYSITVSTKYSGVRVAGIQINITGPESFNTSKVSESEQDAVFTELNEGEYEVKLIIPSASEYEFLSGTDGEETVILSSTNQTENVAFVLQKKAPPVDENYEQIKSIKLPDSLTKIGSTTTLFSKLTQDQLKNVSNFTFDNPGVNKIVYTVPLNLSNYNDFNKINLIDNYLDLGTKGRVRFDTELFPIFNQKARITMSGIRLVDVGDGLAAKINRNGGSFEPKEVTYENNEVKFLVDELSTYTLAPRLVINYDKFSKTATEVEGQGRKTFTTQEGKIDLEFMVDNLDALVNLSNNGEPVNLASEVPLDGKFLTELGLTQGTNRLRLQIKLPSGEQTEEIFQINYEPARPENNVSNLFAILFLLVIIVAVGGIAVYYLKQRATRAKLAMQESSELEKFSKQSEAEQEQKEPVEIYNPDLLTAEEKELYKDHLAVEESKEDSSEKVVETDTKVSEAVEEADKSDEKNNTKS